MKRRPNDQGFTLVELVVYIAIAGIVAAVVAPRFFSRGTFESRGFYDEAQAIIRFAQKTAIAWRRPIFVCISSTTVSAGTATGCAPTISHPTTGNPLTSTAPSGVTLAAVDFRFDGIGRPLDSLGNPSGTIPIAIASTIPGDPARQIVVEAETGYVRR